MLRWFGSVVLILTSVSHCSAQLHCEKPIIPVGEVRSGTTVTRQFTLVNQGTEALVIVEVRPACGCLVPKLEKRRLQPGQATTLSLLANTLTQASGPQSWPLQVAYQCGADDKKTELTLALTATVVPTVSVEPAGLGIYTGSNLPRTVTLLDRRKEPLAIRAVHTTTAKLRAVASAAKQDDAGNTCYTIQLDVAPDFPEGRHDETLFILTTDLDFQELKVPVTVVKKQKQAVCATPESLSVTGAKDQPWPSSLIRLSGPEEEAVVIDHVESDQPALRCTWASGPNHLATVKIAFDRAKMEDDSLSGTIRIQIAKPLPQTVIVPVHCTVR